MISPKYRGRIAPTPSGKLHIGHVQTFMVAQLRAKSRNGLLVLRIEDLDKGRCKYHYLEAMIKDMLWIGLRWDEGPTLGISNAIENNSLYIQTNRIPLYMHAMKKLFMGGYIYPSRHSRRDVEKCLSAPQEGDGSMDEKKRSAQLGELSVEEVDTDIFPSILRPPPACNYIQNYDMNAVFPPANGENWRFRVPYDIPHEMDRWVSFVDENMGMKKYLCGLHFGDFIVWGGQECKPSYELAVVVDDADMNITEVVRGSDLLISTARQILLYEALELPIPSFYHVPLVRDDSGKRLAKRSYDAKYTIESLREVYCYTAEYIIEQMTCVHTCSV